MKKYLLLCLSFSLQANLIELHLTPEEQRLLEPAMSNASPLQKEKIQELQNVFFSNQALINAYIEAKLEQEELAKFVKEEEAFLHKNPNEEEKEIFYSFNKPSKSNIEILKEISENDFKELINENIDLKEKLHSLTNTTSTTFLSEEIAALNMQAKIFIHHINKILTKLQAVESQRWPSNHNEIAFNKLSKKLTDFKRKLESIKAFISGQIIPTSQASGEDDFEIVEI